MSIRFAENMKILPVLAPADIVAVATATAYVDLDLMHWGEFVIQFGAVTSTDSTGGVVVTLEASTVGSSNATETAIAFNYRLSAAVATDTMGAITAAAATGVQVGQASDNTALIVEVDPSAVAAVGADFRFVRAVLTPTSEVSATVVGAIFYGEPRYKKNLIPSST